MLLFAGSGRAQTFTPGPNDTFFFGVLRDELYTDITAAPSNAGVFTGSINPNAPSVTGATPAYGYTDALDFNQMMQVPYNNGVANFVRKLSGVFIPPITTNYVFWISSDDDSQLYLSTDATPFNKTLVAQENNWSNTGQWTASGGGSKISNKRSDQFVPAGATFPPYAAGFPMIAGHAYYMEAYGHQGGGGENLQVTYTYAKGGAPVGNGTAITNNTATGTAPFGYLVHPATFANFSGLSNQVAYSGRAVSFQFKLNTDETPFPAWYQWYGSNQFTARSFVAIPGATTTVLNVKPGTNDNGSAVYVVAGFTNSDSVLLPSNSGQYTSTVATLTVRPDSASTLVQGGLKKEFIDESAVGAAARNQLEVGQVTGPGATDLGNINGAVVSFVPSAIDPVNGNGINNWVQRISGFLTPTNTDTYAFFVSSDDDTDLFLSTDNNPSNKQLIAQESSWSNARQWITANSGSSSQKSSLTWIPSGGTTAPYAAGIPLTAGQSYYIEMVHHQGGGGENVGFTMESVSSGAAAAVTNGQPTDVDPSMLSFLTSPTTKLAISLNPANQSAFSGNSVVFKAAATTDSELTPLYQWQQNGTNLAGATGTALTLANLTTAQTGFTYKFIARIAGSSLSATSTVATLTVQSSVVVTNFLKKEFWGTNGTVNKAQLEANTAGLPDYTAGLPKFFAANSGYLNYAQRISGYFIPPVTTNYIFFIESDDASDLWISTDSTPANKYQIATETAWSNQGQWNSSGGGSTLAQKRSDQYLPGGATVPPYANGILLTAGKQYYIEADHQQGNGGERVEVTFATVSENQSSGVPLDNDVTRIDAGYTGPNTVANGFVGPAGVQFLAPSVPWVQFTTQPVGGTTNVGTVFTFTAAGISPSTTAFSSSTPANQNPPTQTVVYQWLSNGVPILGAIGQSYTTPVLLPGNNGDTYVCQLGALGYQGSSNSVPAVVLINPDNVVPTIIGSSYAYLDQYNNYTVDITFSKWMGGSVTNPANYTLTGGVTVNQVNQVGTNKVQLVLSGFPNPNSFTVRIAGVQDLAGNTLVTRTITSTVYSALTSIDIDPNFADPAQPGWLYVSSTNSFTIASGGSDIWNANDGFRFTYLQKTGDFDIAVQVTGVTVVDQYSKAGLMVREDLTSFSRQWDIVTTGPNTVPALDSSTAFGNGAVEGDVRDTAGAATDANWQTAIAPNIYNPGALPPVYPNVWLRLARVGDNFYGYQSSDGVNWTNTMADSPTNRGSMTPFPSPCYVGMCVTAHDNSANPAFLNISTFQNFQDTATLPIPAVPANLTVTQSGNNVIVSWTPTGGRLLSSSSLAGPWTVVGTANPATVPISGAAQFFRISNP